MKKFLLLLIACILVGCSNGSSDFNSEFDKQINEALNYKLHTHKYKDGFISYYIEPSIGRIETTDTSHVFNYDGTNFIMNINVASIVNEKLYDNKTTSNANSEYLKKGIYKDINGNEHNYEINIDANNKYYLIVFSSDELQFYCYADEKSAPKISGEMLKIARTVTVDRQAVINAFNIKELITYQPSYKELFEEKIPENGSIEELIKDDDILNELEGKDNK